MHAAVYEWLRSAKGLVGMNEGDEEVEVEKRVRHGPQRRRRDCLGSFK